MLFAAVAVILAALAFEHFGGYMPCPLCLQQRYAYYAGIPALFLALVLLSSGRAHAAAACCSPWSRWRSSPMPALGTYHAGAEWKFWPGPDTCGGSQAISTAAGGLFKDLATTRVIRCDEAPWHFLGLSFAGWNVVASLALAAGAAFSAVKARRG